MTTRKASHASVENDMTTPAGLSDARDLVAEQMLDKRLWFHTGTLSEVYLQQALRALHAAVVRAGQAAASVPREPLFSLTLTPEEIFGLVEFSGADEADGTEITIEYRYQHEGGPGWYAHLSEYPEEGSIPVHLPYDDHNADAAPAVAQPAALLHARRGAGRETMTTPAGLTDEQCEQIFRDAAIKMRSFGLEAMTNETLRAAYAAGQAATIRALRSQP
jgi:hypothetical protein